jgi:hypothetical protein
MTLKVGQVKISRSVGQYFVQKAQKICLTHRNMAYDVKKSHLVKLGHDFKSRSNQNK